MHELASRLHKAGLLKEAGKHPVGTYVVLRGQEGSDAKKYQGSCAIEYEAASKCEAACDLNA
jgi:hypothetical protein